MDSKDIGKILETLYNFWNTLLITYSWKQNVVKVKYFFLFGNSAYQLV